LNNDDEYSYSFAVTFHMMNSLNVTVTQITELDMGHFATHVDPTQPTIATQSVNLTTS